MSQFDQNAEALEQELSWFGRVVETRFKLHFHPTGNKGESVLTLTPPDLRGAPGTYARFLEHYEFSFAERLALVLSLVPHLRPQLLDPFYARNPATERRFSEFGGARADGEFVPTGETLAFLLSGNALSVRFALQVLFSPQHLFAKHHILKLAPGPGLAEETPLMKSPLQLSDELLWFFTTGEQRKPTFGTNFPAVQIETSLSWADVVLPTTIRKQLEEIEAWIEHGPKLMSDWGMKSKLRPGYRALFYGPPGTGKTMTACLLGKITGHDVYKVDLSLVMSKYIGETEKNLARVFDQAEHKRWILFFDEADALFGKRSETQDSHDRYANQEVAFLLQRVESFDGIAILASNLRNNIDEAFARRFEAIIYFPMPRTDERARLWRQGFSRQAELGASVDLDKLARDHALSGGAIMNVIRYASLQAIKEGCRPISAEDLACGIQREFSKEGKVR